MAAPVCDPKARKKPVNVSINGDLLRQAREMKINLSRALETQLERLVREERAKRWKEENREAMEAFNRWMEEHGVFSDRLRQF